MFLPPASELQAKESLLRKVSAARSLICISFQRCETLGWFLLALSAPVCGCSLKFVLHWTACQCASEIKIISKGCAHRAVKSAAAKETASASSLERHHHKDILLLCDSLLEI